MFIPAAERAVLEASHANRWRSAARTDYAKKVSLRKTIATMLAQGTIVAFHYDGDTIWSERKQALTPGQFDREIRTPVRQLLTLRGASTNETQLSRLIEVTPHYSIEAWTYQANEKAIEICRSQYYCRDVETFEQWAHDRSTLDELDKPKEQTCLTNQHNEVLARSLPCAEVQATGKSFAHFLRRVAECRELAPLLRPQLHERACEPKLR